MKNKIRNEIIQKKKQYSSKEIASLSEIVFSRITQMPEFSASKQILAYFSVPGEVQTIEFIEHYKDKKDILLPVVDGDVLSLKKYTGKENCIKGAFGIPEPVGTIVSDMQSVDLAIIPGIAFDRAGNRLGRGKGYYDKLLFRFPRKTLKIGVCFDFQLIDLVPTDDWDIPVDMVVTEKGINERNTVKSTDLTSFIQY